MNKYKHNGVEYQMDIDYLNGEAEIYRLDRDGDPIARVDVIDLTDLLATYHQHSVGRAEYAIAQNYKQYETAKHNWFEED